VLKDWLLPSAPKVSHHRLCKIDELWWWCEEWVRPFQEYTRIALFNVTGLQPHKSEQWRVLRCQDCGHLEWFVVGLLENKRPRHTEAGPLRRGLSLWMLLWSLVLTHWPR